MTILGDSINIINNGAADGGNLGSFATAPTANSVGDTYFNTTDNGVYQWDGTSWVPLYTINHLGSFSTAPASPTAGNTYYNTTTNTLMVYNGTSWVSLSGDASTLGSFATAPTATIVGDTYYNTTTNGYYRWDGTSWALLFTLPTANPITVGASPACNTLVITAHTGINTAGVAVNIPASTFTIPAGLSGAVYVMYDIATSTVIANTTGFLTNGTVIPLGVATVPTAGGCITAFATFIDMPEAYQAGGGASNHLGSFATAPSPATAGNTYYNTTTNTLMVYNGTTWLSTGPDGNFVGSGTTAPAVGTTPNGSTFYDTSTDGTGGLYSLVGGVWTLQMPEDQDWKRTTAGLPYPHLTADYTSPIRHAGQVQVGVNVDSTTVSLAVGSGNTTSGINSFSSGFTNTASGTYSAVIGGFTNTASGLNSSVVGGTTNIASDNRSSVVGGDSNTASGLGSSVVGGITNTASSTYSSVIGGNSNIASDINSSVVGGTTNIASGINSSIVGGTTNTASGTSSSVVGGNTNTASGINNFVAGSLRFNAGTTTSVRRISAIQAYGGAGADVNIDVASNVVSIGMGPTAAGVITGAQRRILLGNADLASNRSYVGIGINTATEFLDVLGNTKTSGAFIVSDKQHKQAIEYRDMATDLERILQLNPVSYQWTDSYDAEYGSTGRKLTHEGIIAQELQAVIPNAVKESYTPVEYEEVEVYEDIEQSTFDKEGNEIKEIVKTLVGTERTGKISKPARPTGELVIEPMAIISTLIGAVKAQQKQIDDLKLIVDKLTSSSKA